MTWRPTGTKCSYEDRPVVGTLIPLSHAVWRVTAIEDIEMDADDIEVWSEPWRKQPNVSTWQRRPYRVHWEYVGGRKPKGMKDDGKMSTTVRSRAWRRWDYYANDRWPMCSCCGEPMPCRADLTDRVVERDLARIETMQSRMPGSCWGCGDPISQRQKAIRYVGDNVDLPGGLPVVFHLRKDCYMSAVKYEERWLATDHSRRRILTYPECDGGLYSHQDGSHECVGDGRDPECDGIGVSHNHGYLSGCRTLTDGCPRGCPPEDSYCRPLRGRTQFRDPDLPQGQLPEKPAALDRRIVCPGHLLVHQDGTSDCIAGGRDDCWGGEQFRHERKRDCRTQSAGCARCEVVS